MVSSALIMLLEKPIRSESFQASLPALLSEYFSKRSVLVSEISLSSTSSLLVILFSRLSTSACFSVILDSALVSVVLASRAFFSACSLSSFALRACSLASFALFSALAFSLWALRFSSSSCFFSFSSFCLMNCSRSRWSSPVSDFF